MGKRVRASQLEGDADGCITVIPRWSGPPPRKPIVPPSSGCRIRQALPKPAALDLDLLREAIQVAVGRAVGEIDLEEHRSEADLVKRIAKYVYKAASDPELLQLPWEVVCHKVVDRSMQGYTASCGQAPWFFDINLPPVFCAAVWEILRGSGQGHLTSTDTVQNLVILEYDAQLDRMLLDKAMWEVASTTFSDEKVKSKIFQAISRSYVPALDAALVPALMQEETHGNLTPDQEERHVEAFMKKWISEAMSRAWASLEQVGGGLTEDIMVEIFQKLIVPFGEEDPFTCIPGVLTETIGRPPSDWPFIAQAVEELLSSWEDSAARNSAKKRRRQSNSGAEEAMEEAEVIMEAQPDEEHPQLKARRRAKINVPTQESLQHRGASFSSRRKAETLDVPNGELDEESGPEGGHPMCTSEEDCIGTPDNRLIQHMFNGGPGDVYCEPCWKSFSRRNPSLKGQYVAQ